MLLNLSEIPYWKASFWKELKRYVYEDFAGRYHCKQLDFIINLSRNLLAASWAAAVLGSQCLWFTMGWHWPSDSRALVMFLFDSSWGINSQCKFCDVLAYKLRFPFFFFFDSSKIGLKPQHYLRRTEIQKSFWIISFQYYPYIHICVYITHTYIFIFNLPASCLSCFYKPLNFWGSAFHLFKLHWGYLPNKLASRVNVVELLISIIWT